MSQSSDSSPPRAEDDDEGSCVVMEGQDALNVAADLLRDAMGREPRLKMLMAQAEPAKVTAELQSFLGVAFKGEPWPQVNIGKELIDECFNSFLAVLLMAVQKTMDEGTEAAEVLPKSIGLLNEDFKTDAPLVIFFEAVHDMAVNDEDDDSSGGSDNIDFDKSVRRIMKRHGGQQEEEQQEPEPVMEIQTTSFDELVMEPHILAPVTDVWERFLEASETKENAGDAIYSAIFESAPSLQPLFTQPRAVQALRFVVALHQCVQLLGQPPRLKVAVETLGFGHLTIDVTIPRVVIIRDAIIDLFQVELGDKFNSFAEHGWHMLLNYIGGAIIYVRENYAQRITCLLASWKNCNRKHDTAQHDDESSSSASEDEDAKEGETPPPTKAKAKAKATAKAAATPGSSNRIWNRVPRPRWRRKSTALHENGHASEQKAARRAQKNVMAVQNVPTTFHEMFLFNAPVMGFQSIWMTDVLAVFDNIVTNVANSSRLEQECDVLALRISKSAGAKVNLGEYKSCMLASLRSLLPKDWDSSHEVAWTWLWETVERLVLGTLGKPTGWEKNLSKFMDSLDEEQKYEMRKEVYVRFFATAPNGQNYFKQSNAYLHFIAEKVMQMTLEIYREPGKMVDDLSALGLRHVGYGVITDLFPPFVNAWTGVMFEATEDQGVIESFQWSLGLISKILVRTVTEGSTIVMKAINANSAKKLRAAVACAPRGARAQWLLLVQVGTQSISPLGWALESESREALSAMLKDLLTIRADRDRYYYGMEELFRRHPDIISLLSNRAPTLLPVLLDGLIWRSRLAEGGLRRVIYFVKYLLVDEEGGFSKAIEWISKLKDPKLVCHEVLVFVSDLLWNNVNYRVFLYGKSWFLLTLLLFIASQSILEHIGDNRDEKPLMNRSFIFSCRFFIYCCSMAQLIYRHAQASFLAYRSGDVFLLGCAWLPNYLRTKWQDAASAGLTVGLFLMLCFEPIMFCWKHNHGEIFTETCPESKPFRFTYAFFSMIASFMYYLLLVDLATVSTRVSAFLLVCIRMTSEVGLFLGAVIGLSLAFASASSVLEHNNMDFRSIHAGSYSYFRMFLRIFATERFEVLRPDGMLLAVIIIYLLAVHAFLLNLLVAQISCEYSNVYEDMVGFARLERLEIIVSTMPSAPKARWAGFVARLQLDTRLEFNKGDVGLAGGIQLQETASAHPTTVDRIKRFGGPTSEEMQWPAEEQDKGNEDERIARMDKLMTKTIGRFTKKLRHIGLTGKKKLNGESGQSYGSSDSSDSDSS